VAGLCLKGFEELETLVLDEGSGLEIYGEGYIEENLRGLFG